MVWVRSEYAGELAVLSAWLSALVPWNVMLSSVADGSILFVRFPFFQVRYVVGLPVQRAFTVTDPLTAIAFQTGTSIVVAYQVWAAGAGVLAVAVLFSVAYYAAEERVEALSVDPVRLMGGLLGLGGLVLAASTYLLVTQGFPGIPVPVGIALLFVFSWVLLTIERTESGRHAEL